uniref:Uncharacterized protein n=1 Tax=Ditylum brightwellii TaxID=49249 RepID=A0A7S2A4L2_9STRA
MSSAMVRAYCHKVIKLSDTLQTFALEKEAISNVHGVRAEFTREGARRAATAIAVSNRTNSMNATVVEANNNRNNTDIYFIGKILWAKGLDKLLELEDFYRKIVGEYFPIDIFGSGPEKKEIMRAFHGRKLHFKEKADGNENSLSTIISAAMEVLNDPEFGSESGDLFEELTDEIELNGVKDDAHFFHKEEPLTAKDKLGSLLRVLSLRTESLEIDLPKSLHEWRKQPVPSRFPGRVDHALLKDQFKIFVNPSVTEVLCTTTAEALAMGKFAIIPDHPSNRFFMKFPNCLVYQNKWEFVANLRWAQSHEPEPLTPELLHEFTWEAATERFINAAAITNEEAKERARLGKTKLDERIAWFHNELGKGVKGDRLRKVLGGGPISDQVKYVKSKIEGQEPGFDECEDDIDNIFRNLGYSSITQSIRSSFEKGILLPNSLAAWI